MQPVVGKISYVRNHERQLLLVIHEVGFVVHKCCGIRFPGSWTKTEYYAFVAKHYFLQTNCRIQKGDFIDILDSHGRIEKTIKVAHAATEQRVDHPLSVQVVCAKGTTHNVDVIRILTGREKIITRANRCTWPCL